MTRKKALVSLSGGLDSAVLLGDLLSMTEEYALNITAVSFVYGSLHNYWELLAARRIAEHYKIAHDKVHVTDVFDRFGECSALFGDGEDIPSGHYHEESMKKTVVPCRNLIFASVLAGLAEVRGCEFVYLAIHQGDHHIYPDCRPEFFEGARKAVWYGTDSKVCLCAPFLHYDKADIVRLGAEKKVPFALTRTCYRNQEKACGKCGACQERLEAFKQNGIEDPIEYESREILKKM